jgi:DNA adenine methylase
VYHEPFLGGGALFFYLQNKLGIPSSLSDSNRDLIIAWQTIQQDPEKLLGRLREHEKKHCEEWYYLQRSLHDLQDPVDIAARLIYLNKTCFNGLYRVNRRGEFNVPMGSYTKPNIVQEANIHACHLALQNTYIEHRSFEEIQPLPGDFVYFDPPYHPSDPSTFTAYTSENFAEKDQRRLRDFAMTLHERGVLVMLSNSDTPLIRELYDNSLFTLHVVFAPRHVNRNGAGRGPVAELLITTYG